MPRTRFRPPVGKLGAAAWLCCGGVLWLTTAWGQAPAGQNREANAEPSLQAILARLERLEAENRALRGEVAALREAVSGQAAKVAPAFSAEPGTLAANAEPETGKEAATLPERLEILEKQVAEQATTKVEASNRMPVQFTGMGLFNAFYGTGGMGGADTPTTANATVNRASGGATFRQTVLGVKLASPMNFIGAKITGSVYADFYDGNTEAATLALRFRMANVTMDWNRRSFTIGQMKPLISPNDPSSYAIVGVDPLTSAGNLWRWVPQVRYEERFGERAAVQVAVVQNLEESTLPVANAALAQRRRPGLQLRLVGKSNAAADRPFEVGVGAHFSESRVAGQGVGSQIASTDWSVRPWQRVEISGLAWAGTNVHHMGALRQSFRNLNATLLAGGRIEAVRSVGGWAQVAITAAPRLTVNSFLGVHDDRNADLIRGQVGRNLTGGVNFFYRLAPNVVTGFEVLRTNTTFVGAGTRSFTRYDLSLAYLF